MLLLNPSDDDDELSNLPDQLNFRTAWPIFNVRFCRFELDQWMDASGTLGDLDQDEESIRQEREAKKE